MWRDETRKTEHHKPSASGWKQTGGSKQKLQDFQNLFPSTGRDNEVTYGSASGSCRGTHSGCVYIFVSRYGATAVSFEDAHEICKNTEKPGLLRNCLTLGRSADVVPLLDLLFQTAQNVFQATPIFWQVWALPEVRSNPTTQFKGNFSHFQTLLQSIQKWKLPGEA